MATLKTGLNGRQALLTDSLGGPGPIAYDETTVDSNALKRKEIDRMRELIAARARTENSQLLFNYHTARHRRKIN